MDINVKRLALGELMLMKEELKILDVNILQNMNREINKLTTIIMYSQLFVNATINNNIKIICSDANNIILKSNIDIDTVKLCNSVLNHNIDTNFYTINFNFKNEIFSYKVHSFIIDYEYFNIVKNNNYNESISKIFELKINHNKTGEDFIKYIYNKELDIKYDIINRLDSLIVLANYLTINDLSNLCLNTLSLISTH